MAATPMAATSRYFRPGVTKVYWVETLTDYENPTRSELDAGTDLSAEVAEINGFQVTSASVDTPDLGSRFTAKIPGAITADDSSLVTYADTTSVDIRSVLVRDDNGFVVIMDEGDIVGQLMDVYPARVASTPKLRAREDPARIQADFTITKVPAENITIPS